MSLESMLLTTAPVYDVLFTEGWKETVAVKSLTELSGLVAPDGARVLVLDADAVYTLAEARTDTADGVRVIARTVGNGRWFLFLPDFGLLWVCQQASVTGDPHLYAFTREQASIDPSNTPWITLTLPTNIGPGTPHGVNAFTFAPNGDMWIGFAENQSTSVSYGQHVAKLSASKLLTTGAVTPDFSFALPAGDAGSTAGVSAMCMDRAGNLWVSGVSTVTKAAGIYCFSAASIAAPGAPAPIIVLKQPGALHSANDLWFDSAGNLWVADDIGKTVCRLSTSQLATNYAIVPDVVLSFPDLTYSGVTTDAAGNLWCGSSGTSEAHMFDVKDIQASGSPTPKRIIKNAASTVQGKLRFDKHGYLWLQSALGPKGYPSWDVVRSGSTAPSATLTGAGVFSSARVLNFDPQSFT